MTDECISPLRRRMIEDMTVRNFVPKTQSDYIRRVKNFAVFLGRTPDRVLDLLRNWWLVCRSRGWLFPGRGPLQRIPPRQLPGACHEAAQAAGIDKPASPHTLRH